MRFDLPLDELKTYLPPRHEPHDFDAFWQGTLDQSRLYPLQATFEPVDFSLQSIQSFDLTFRGYDGQAIKAWWLQPRTKDAGLGCVVEFISYGGGRGFPIDWLQWASVGYAHLVMDTRGQGSGWRHGDTPDLQPEGGNPHYPGVMTMGILDPRTYYYRRLYTDAVRAVEVARNHPDVDSRRIAVTGRSQGGGVALAVAGMDAEIAVCMPDVPFLCHFRRALEITDSTPYTEISAFLRVQRDKVDQVFRTLSYFDGVHFAMRARASALFSVGLMDLTCPPSTVFAAYNHYAGEKQIRIWHYNEHEGGQSHQEVEKIAFLRDIWQAEAPEGSNLRG